MDIPETLGKYRIDALLGQGAMGIVYKGFDTVLERQVAIKIVRKELLAETDTAAYLVRFKREALAAGRFLHPNIVAVYDYADFDGQPYIAMEYVDGRSLQALLKQQPRFAAKDASLIALQLLSALACAHSFGVVHRDIKPANIMILDNGQAKVGDFGVSRIDASDLTRDGSVVGTPSYMSPEQCKGAPLDHRADLFAAGVVLYEMLAGHKPYPGTSFSEVLYKVLHEEPRSLAEMDIGSPPALNAVVQQSLAKDPAQRFQSADAFAEALKSATAVPDPRPAVDAFGDQTVVLPAYSTATDALPPGMDAEVLLSVERKLTYYIGPMAKLLVRRAASHSGSMEELTETLSANIPSEAGRREFIEFSHSQASHSGVRHGSGSGVRGSGSGIGGSAAGRSASGFGSAVRGSGTHASTPLSPEKIEAAQQALAFHIGPIAKVLVKRAAAQSTSLQDLHARLAATLDREADRQAFLAAVSGR